MSIEVDQETMARSDEPWAAGPETPRYAVLRKIASSELLVWVALVLLFTALPLVHISEATIGDPDIWWHMRAGEWIIQHHQVPHADPFAASTMGHPWVDYSWMFEVAANWLIGHFDLAAIMWYQIAMRLAIAAALLALLRSVTSHFWRAVMLTALAMFAMIQMFGPRPALFSILFLILELYLLLRAQRTGSPRTLWAIPFLFAIWTNVHIEFVNGLFVLAVFCMEPILERISGIGPTDRTATAVPNRRLWFVSGASLLATVANPYGIQLHLTALRYARDTKVYDAIDELRAMSFRHPAHWGVLLLVMLGCFALGRLRPIRPVWVILLGWSAWMSFRASREVWLITIIAVVLIASKDLANSPVRRRIGLQMRLAVAGSVCVVLFAGASYWHMNSQNLFRQVSENFPVGAVSYIHRNHLQGPMLNDFSWGGFLIYALPEIPVSVDGRTNVHAQDDVLRAISLYKGEPGWRNRPELVKANLVISDHTWPLTGLLRRDPRFRVVYEDLVSVLFQAVPQPATSKEARSGVE